jgi:hypothetical protein
MRVDELIPWASRNPFKPFWVVTEQGETYTALYRSLAQVVESQNVYYLYLFEPVGDDDVEVKVPPRVIELARIKTVVPVEPTLWEQESIKA